MFSLLHRLDSSWFTQEGPSAFPSQHKPGTSLSTSVLFTLSAFENVKLKSENEEESMNVKYNYSIKYKHKSDTCMSTTSVLFTLSAFVQLDKSESGESFEHVCCFEFLSILAHPLIICFALMVYSITLRDLKLKDEHNI